MKLPNLQSLSSDVTFSELPEGADALLLCDLVREVEGPLLHVARDDKHLDRLSRAVAFFAPGVEIIEIPAWDCLPYDRVSPSHHVVSLRMQGLCRLVGGKFKGDAIILTTVNALMQRVPSREVLKKASFFLRPGEEIGREGFLEYLVANGYVRSPTLLSICNKTGPFPSSS